MSSFARLRIFFKNIIYIISTTEQVYTTKKDLEHQGAEIERLKTLLKNHDLYINSHTDQLQSFRETMKEYPTKFTQLGNAHSALKQNYEKSQEANKAQHTRSQEQHARSQTQHTQLQAQHAKVQEKLAHFQEKISKYEEIHTNTERAMYHFIQKQFLAQSLLYHDKLQALLQNPTEQNAKDLTKEYLDSYYLAFEDKFRGSRESILARYEAYYRFVPNTPQKALDIGCGRGEWVELLQAKGIESHGVDLNSAMLGIAKDTGVQNLHDQDAFAFLEATPAQSYDLISAFHIIEHIPFEKLLLLLTQIKRVAKQGATILLETPNPANLQVAANHFYNDPTHLNPLPHRVMEFMLEYLGFFEVKTHHINPYADAHHLGTNTPEASTLNRYLFGAQDYIITAKA